MKIGKIREEIITAKETALLSKATIMTYENVLNHLENFFGKDKDVETIKMADIKDYILKRKTWKRSSLVRHICHLKTIFSYLEKHNFIKFNIMNRVQTPRNEEIPIDNLTVKELEALDKASMSPVIDSRRRALYWVIRETGLRANEASNILLKDVDLERNIILIRRSKNKIIKTIPLSTHTKKMLQIYLLENAPTTIYLFGNDRGGNPLRRESISRLLDDIYDKAFDLKRWSKKRGAHLLRHACASEWVANNGNLKGLQFMMGWRSLQMCDRYVHASPEIIKDMFNTMHKNKKEKK